MLDWLIGLWGVFIENWWVFLLIPVISAVVGYVTNIVALNMMFKPIEFIGIPPFLGWQGIVPRKAETMAAIAVDTITNKLISPKEFTDRLDPTALAHVLEEPLRQVMRELTHDVLAKQYPTIWSNLPETVRQGVFNRLESQIPNMVKDITRQLQENSAKVLDVEHIVITHLKKDKRLLNRIFLEVGEPEFSFVARSGAYFGFLLGVLQMFAYLVYPVDWLLPVFGLWIGFMTNWLALKIIFEPKEPKKFGPITVQGLFLKRQNEVASHYGRLIAQEILTPKRLLIGILEGPGSDHLFEIVQKEIDEAVDESVGSAMPAVRFAIGDNNYQTMKRDSIQKSLERLPQMLTLTEDYVDRALQLENTLSYRLTKLSPTDFEGLLRPAFEQDEWMLILAGAVLGMLAGMGQLAIFLAL